MNETIVVYTSRGCPYCEKVKDILKDSGAEFEEKNITLNESFFKEWKAKEVIGTPATFYKEKEVVGVNKKKLQELVDLYKSTLS